MRSLHRTAFQIHVQKALLRISAFPMTPKYIEDDLVEDSEPEREALRKGDGMRVFKDYNRSPALLFNPEVIDITDDEGKTVPDVYRQSAAADLPTVDLAHDLATTSDAPPSPPTSLLIASPSTAGRVSEYFSGPSRTSHDPMPDNSVLLDDNEDDQLAPRMSIARFAYSSNSARQHSLSRANLASRTSSSSSIVTIPPPVPRKKIPSQNPFATRFSDAQLAKLLKCVSCDMKWTARKSAAQKMTHVRACAKKRAFSDDTICALIEKELAQPLPEKTDQRALVKGKVKITAPPKTFFEEVVQNAGGQRKQGKRRKVVESVQSAAERRDDILKRAHATFGFAGSDNNADDSGGAKDKDADLPYEESSAEAGSSRHHARMTRSDTLQFEPSNFVTREAQTVFNDNYDPTYFADSAEGPEGDHIPATQAFAPSKLGSRGSRPEVLLRDFDEEEEGFKVSDHSSIVGPSSPPVQSYATSKFATRINLLPESDSEEDALVVSRTILTSRAPASSEILRRLDDAIQRANAGANPKRRAAASPKIRAKALPAAVVEDPARDKEHKHRPVDEHDLSNDEAQLHYIPCHKRSPTKNPSLLPIATSSKKPSYMIPLPPYLSNSSKSRHPKKSTDAGNHNANANVSTNPLVSTLKPKTRRRKETYQDENDLKSLRLGNEEWPREFRQQILQDEELHLRILRYEPIHFSEFLKYVTGEHTDAVKAKIRDILDKLAINFYDAEPRSRRR